MHPIALLLASLELTLSSRLWFIAGKAYDLSDFVRKHPGGRAAILLGRGTNCTELFRSYHFLKEPPAKLLAKYEVDVDRREPENVELLGGSDYTFDEDGFYKTVSRRATDYFRGRSIGIRGSLLCEVLSIASILVVVALTYPAYVQGSVLAAVALGFMRAMASIGPGHSMSHFSLFPRGRWNALAFRLGSPLLVSSWAIWSASHVRSHHVDTLTADDLQDHYPLKRIQPALPHRAWHRGQHVYAWLIYLLGLPLWALQDLALSVLSLFTKKHMTNHFSLYERIENTLAIAFNIGFAMVLPFLFLPWPNALLVSLVANAVSSLFVVVQIVVNHEVPETMSQVTAGESVDWGEHQVLTSHNYGADSALALHLSGGLNMQIEHHLFPSVHYTHFPALSGIVREACAEFGLPYNTSVNIWGAIAKHYRILQMNSVPPAAVVEPALADAE